MASRGAVGLPLEGLCMGRITRRMASRVHGDLATSTSTPLARDRDAELGAPFGINGDGTPQNDKRWLQGELSDCPGHGRTSRGRDPHGASSSRWRPQGRLLLVCMTRVLHLSTSTQHCILMFDGLQRKRRQSPSWILQPAYPHLTGVNRHYINSLYVRRWQKVRVLFLRGILFFNVHVTVILFSPPLS